MRSVLRQVADYARDHSSERLVIVGHTDRAGSPDYNQSLSERRSRSVFAYLTVGVDEASRAAAIAEWNHLRETRPAGEQPSIKDSWDVREYQQMLQVLGFYPGPIDGERGSLTNGAVQSYRCQRGFPPGTGVDPEVWQALIEDYLTQEALAVSTSQFFPNCPGEILKWLGCGETDPRDRRSTAFRPSRRVELMFVQTDRLPCQIPQPATFNLPTPGTVNANWCVGGTSGARCCLVSPILIPGRNDPQPCPTDPNGPWCRQPAEPGTLTVQGSIRREIRLPDGTVRLDPVPRQEFVLIAPNGQFKQSEQSRGDPSPARTDNNGEFSFPDLPVGIYTLEVVARRPQDYVLVRLESGSYNDALGAVVCKHLTPTDTQLNVVIVAAPVLREIRLPVVAHLMTALHPITREIRTCPVSGSTQREDQATAHTEADVRAFFEEANQIWRPARIRFELTDIVQEAYAFRTECEVDESEFTILLERCAYPNAVNVFFMGDLAGIGEAGFGISPEAGAALGVAGCAVGDRFQTTILGPPLSITLDPPQTVQVLAHELGHFLNLEHTDETPTNANRLMFPIGAMDGSNRNLVQTEIDRARASQGADLECRPLTLQVTGNNVTVAQVGGSLSHEYIVIQNPTGTVTVTATAHPSGTVEMTDGTTVVSDRQFTVSTAATGITTVTATYTSRGGGNSFTARVAIRVVTFRLRVEGAQPLSGSSNHFITLSNTNPNSRVLVIAEIDPALFCVPRDLITWTGDGTATSDPLRWSVSTIATGSRVINATLAGTTRSVTITTATVQLQSIKFNHDATAATTDALNIRRNATQAVTIPEWQHSISNNSADSLAAYAIRETQGNTISIQAQFQLSESHPLSAQIRATAVTPHVLGEVRAKQVFFLANGITNFEPFELQNVQIWSSGVGIHDITWQWQVRLQSTDPWIDLTTSRHRIYILLEVPKSPWQQSPFAPTNTQLPWTEVLNYACRWASGATQLDDVATLVTREVYHLGEITPQILEYDCPGGGGTRYAYPDFDCTAFLERLGGGTGRGRYVNCSDCATIVSTFANSLGCDLWQSRMGNSFALNPILAIGSSIWQTACGWDGFSYHEVAWKGACTANEEVFDACLQVDGDIDPTTAPHTPLLPTNLRFGNPDDGQYRDRLAAPSGRLNCNPQPTTRTRRQIT
jgi:hypothetical protein